MTDLKITKDTYNELMPNAPIDFIILLNSAYTPQRLMKHPTNYNQIRYLFPEDIVMVMDRRLKSTPISAGTLHQKNVEKWKKMKEIAEKLIQK